MTPVEFIKTRLDNELAKDGRTTFVDDHGTFGTYWRIIDGGKAKPIWTEGNLKVYRLIASHSDWNSHSEYDKIEWPPMVA